MLVKKVKYTFSLWPHEDWSAAPYAVSLCIGEDKNFFALSTAFTTFYTLKLSKEDKIKTGITVINNIIC